MEKRQDEIAPYLELEMDEDMFGENDAKVDQKQSVLKLYQLRSTIGEVDVEESPGVNIASDLGNGA